MWHRFKSLRVLLSSVLICALASIACADTIRLKDGSIIKGHVVSFRGGSFIVEIGEGSRRKQLMFAASEIESITFDAPSSQSANPANQPVSYPKPEPKIVQPTKVITTESIPRVVESKPKPQPSGSNAKTSPIVWTKKVLADNTNNGWTNAGWVVKKGQRIRITGEGNISLGKGRTASPSGIAELDDEQKLMKSVPTGALIAVIGDDNNDFIYVGAEREFTATRDGALFLGINETNLTDNSGTFDVKIEIIPDGAR